MTIKLCGPENTAEVGRLYDKAVKYLCEHVNYPKWTYKVYPSLSFAEQKQKEGCLFACFGEDNAVIGAFVLNFDPEGAYGKANWSRNLPQGEYMVCHALATDPERGREGIGEKMVLFCIEHAKSQGAKAVRLDVVPDNYPAKRLYEKCGFKYIGDADLERGISYIPTFSLYELNL